MSHKSKEGGSRQQKTSSQRTTERGLPSGTTTNSPKGFIVKGTTKGTTERQVHGPGAENSKEENSLKENIRRHLQEVFGIIEKPDAMGSKAPGKGTKVNSQDLVADLAYVCSWIKERKAQWHGAEKEIEQMKQFIETSQTSQKAEENTSSKNQKNDNKTSQDELATELTNVRSWVMETIEKSKSSMEQIGKQIIGLKQLIEEPDGISQTEETSQDTNAIPAELLSCIKQVQNWIAKGGSRLVKQKLKDQSDTLEQQYTELTRDVQECCEMLNNTSNVADDKGRKKDPLKQQETKDHGTKEMKLHLDNYIKEYKRLEQQYTELTRDVQECCEMLNNTSDVADDKGRKKDPLKQQETKDHGTKELKLHLDNYIKEYKSKSVEATSQIQKQSEEFSLALERIQVICKEGIHAQPSEQRKASTNGSQSVKHQNLQTLVNDTITVVTTKLNELGESNKALESNTKKTLEENQRLKEQVNSKSAEVDETTLKLQRQNDAFFNALDLIQTTCKNGIGERLKETKKNRNALDTTGGAQMIKNRNLEKTATEVFELVTETLRQQDVIKSENDNLRREIGELHKSYEAAKSRLSKYMGADLRAGNPNIADLSDANRPTKIAEAFSELYDNSWTNAFEELNKRKKATEIDTIENLLDILKFASEYCTKAAKQQLPELEYYMRSPVAPLLGKAKKELKKEEEGVDAVTLQALHDFRKKTWTIASANLIKHYEKLMRSEKKWKDEYSTKDCSLYITTCIQLCWQMAIQDPPVLIRFEKKQKTLKFDKEKYRAYMRSGEEVSFIVWPPIYLHEGGPLLIKGVAEGK